VGLLVNGLAPLAGSAGDRERRHRKALAPTGLSVEESYANDSSAPFSAPVRSVGRVTVATDRISDSYKREPSRYL